MSGAAVLIPDFLHGASIRDDTHLFSPHNSSFYLTTTTYVRRSGRITNGIRDGPTTPQDSVFSSPTPAPNTRNDLPVQPGFDLTDSHQYRTFPLLLVQMGYSLLCACECGAEQTVEHVALRCHIHRPPHGLHDPTVLDDETIEWLLNTWPEI